MTDNPDELRALAVEGLVEVGEITTRVQREAISEPDFREAMKASEVKAYAACAVFATEIVATAGPYDDVRALRTMLTWLSDRVRETQTPSYDGGSDATA